MRELELPNGEIAASGDVILFEGYPYRVRLSDGIVLSPLYWGDSDLDLEFESAAELAERWGDESRGLLRESEWEAWLADARADDRFGDVELDAVAEAVLPPSGPVERLRRWLRRT